MMKELIKRSKLVFSIRILLEHIRKSMVFIKSMSNTSRKDGDRAMLSNLKIRTHALEKGMSIGAVKKGFGKIKAISLMDDLQTFLDICGDREFVGESVSVIREYVAFNKRMGADMSDIENKLGSFCERNKVEFCQGGGIFFVTHSNVQAEATENYEHLSQARFAVRDYGSAPIDIDKIKKALALCERTPSACNRQSWRIHIYTEKKLRDNLFIQQLGCNGFYEDMQCAILICGDAGCYAFPEFNTPYVDGGIYAMNLMYALNYYDLACIPLTLDLSVSKINILKKEMHLPQNELPVLLIGVGSYKENFKVACSNRTPYTEYVTFN